MKIKFVTKYSLASLFIFIYERETCEQLGATTNHSLAFGANCCDAILLIISKAGGSCDVTLILAITSIIYEVMIKRASERDENRRLIVFPPF